MHKSTKATKLLGSKNGFKNNNLAPDQHISVISKGWHGPTDSVCVFHISDS